MKPSYPASRFRKFCLSLCLSIGAMQMGHSQCNIVLHDSIIHPSCSGINGIASLFASGGAAPYIYTLTGSGVHTTQSSDTFTNVPAGIDTFSVTDSNACYQYLVVNMQNGSAISPTVSITAAATSFCGTSGFVDTFWATSGSAALT
jgi:hypothetical protein